jgi:hypothetical protein
MRYDLVFSYWILVWWMLYICRLTGHYNPKFLLILGIIENLVVIFAMIYYQTKSYLIFLFILIFIFIKIIPLYIIRNSIIQINDIYASILLFSIYLLWLHLNHIPLNFFTKKMHDFIIKNKNIFPTMQLIMKLFREK